MPASDGSDGEIEQLAEHGRGVLPVHLFEVFVEAEEVEPIGFGEGVWSGFPLFLKFFGEGEFEGGVAVGSRGQPSSPTTRMVVCPLTCPHGAPTVTFDELQALAVGHGSEGAGEGELASEGECGFPQGWGVLVGLRG